MGLGTVWWRETVESSLFYSLHEMLEVFERPAGVL